MLTMIVKQLIKILVKSKQAGNIFNGDHNLCSELWCLMPDIESNNRRIMLKYVCMYSYLAQICMYVFVSCSNMYVCIRILLKYVCMYSYLAQICMYSVRKGCRKKDTLTLVIARAKIDFYRKKFVTNSFVFFKNDTNNAHIGIMSFQHRHCSVFPHILAEFEPVVLCSRGRCNATASRHQGPTGQ
jgi:hypothetical protein